MTKIEESQIKKGIKIATDAISSSGIIAEINIERIPEDDEVKKGEFHKIIILNGVIKYGEDEKNFDFFIAIPVASHREPKDWSWLIASSFLSHAACTFDGDDEKIKYLLNLRMDIVNKLRHA